MSKISKRNIAKELLEENKKLRDRIERASDRIAELQKLIEDSNKAKNAEIHDMKQQLVMCKDCNEIKRNMYVGDIIRFNEFKKTPQFVILRKNYVELIGSAALVKTHSDFNVYVARCNTFMKVFNNYPSLIIFIEGYILSSVNKQFTRYDNVIMSLFKIHADSIMGSVYK